MDLSERLDRLESEVGGVKEDVRDLKTSFHLHEERHGDDADMLQLVLDNQATHTNNHHGISSTMKQSAGIGGALAFLGVLAELLRHFFL